VLLALDTAVLRALRAGGHTPATQAAVARFSSLGEHGALWLGVSALGAALSPRDRAGFLRAARTVLIAYALNQAIKFTVRRRRPRIAEAPQLTRTASQLSWPSAHAATSFAGARALSGLLPAAPLYAVATAIAVSRPYLGVHYPSDSIAGAALGTAVAELTS
jgi:membrane-associated phospholipid phosphatase